MKTKALIAPAYFLVLLLVASGAYWRGRRDVWISEFKTYDAKLIRLSELETNRSPELKEFIKGRYYYCANKIPKSWLGSPYDYGPVSTNLGNLTAEKGPTSAQEEYRKFKERGVPLRSSK